MQDLTVKVLTSITSSRRIPKFSRYVQVPSFRKLWQSSRKFQVCDSLSKISKISSLQNFDQDFENFRFAKKLSKFFLENIRFAKKNCPIFSKISGLQKKWSKFSKLSKIAKIWMAIKYAKDNGRGFSIIFAKYSR